MDNNLLKFSQDNSKKLMHQFPFFSACLSQDDTQFTINFCGMSDIRSISDKTSGILFACDGIVFQSFGSQVHLIVPHEIMREIFAELLNRNVFSIAVFEGNIGHLSPDIAPVVAILRHFVAKLDGDDHANILAITMLRNLARQVAYSWPNTHSSELSLSAAERPPLPLRLALDFIFFKKGVVESVHDVAAHTNVGLRTLEIIFSDFLGIGIKRYCKSIMLRIISEQLQNKSQRLTRIALEFDVSNVGRLRKELKLFAENATHVPYPWEIYDPRCRFHLRL